jgi:hypothetical protein
VSHSYGKTMLRQVQPFRTSHIPLRNNSDFPVFSHGNSVNAQRDMREKSAGGSRSHTICTFWRLSFKDNEQDSCRQRNVPRKRAFVKSCGVFDEAKCEDLMKTSAL